MLNSCSTYTLHSEIYSYGPQIRFVTDWAFTRCDHWPNRSRTIGFWADDRAV